MMVLAIIGVLAALVGGIMMLVEAFRESILWGICSLIIPGVILVFAILNWDRCQKGFLIWLIGTIVYFIFGSVAVEEAGLEVPPAN